MSRSVRRGLRALVVLAVAAAVAAGLLGGTATAVAAPRPVAPPITNIGADVIAGYHPARTALHRSTRVQLPAGTYTYGQSYDRAVTHNVPAMTVPAGHYMLHDSLDDNLDAKIHTSYLDPAPDPNDPTSGVIVTLHPLPVFPGTTDWGSLLIRQP